MMDAFNVRIIMFKIWTLKKSLNIYCSPTSLIIASLNIYWFVLAKICLLIPLIQFNPCLFSFSQEKTQTQKSHIGKVTFNNNRLEEQESSRVVGIYTLYSMTIKSWLARKSLKFCLISLASAFLPKLLS